jgi:hypothetical protein
LLNPKPSTSTSGSGSTINSNSWMEADKEEAALTPTQTSKSEPKTFKASFHSPECRICSKSIVGFMLVKMSSGGKNYSLYIHCLKIAAGIHRQALRTLFHTQLT